MLGNEHERFSYPTATSPDQSWSGLEPQLYSAMNFISADRLSAALARMSSRSARRLHQRSSDGPILRQSSPPAEKIRGGPRRRSGSGGEEVAPPTGTGWATLKGSSPSTATRRRCLLTRVNKDQATCAWRICCRCSILLLVDPEQQRASPTSSFFARKASRVHGLGPKRPIRFSFFDQKVCPLPHARAQE